MRQETNLNSTLNNGETITVVNVCNNNAYSINTYYNSIKDTFVYVVHK